MKAMNLKDVKELVGKEYRPALSLYIPIGEKTSKGVPKGVSSYVEGLIKRNYSRSLATILTQNLGEVEIPPNFEGTLCRYRSLGVDGYMLLPGEFHNLSVVASSFHLKPVLSGIQEQDRYYVLELSSYHAQLYEGDSLGCRVRWQRENKYALSRAWERQTEGEVGDKRLALRAKPDSFSEKLAFLIDVNAALAISAADGATIILKADRKEATLFRCISTVPNLSKWLLNHLKPMNTLEELHKKALAIVKKNIELQSLSKITASDSEGKLPMTSINEIVPSLRRNEIDSVYISKAHTLWGHIDWTNGKVSTHETQRDAMDDDVLDDIAEKAILNGVPVYVLDPAEFPYESEILAFKNTASVSLPSFNFSVRDLSALFPRPAFERGSATIA